MRKLTITHTIPQNGCHFLKKDPVWITSGFFARYWKLLGQQEIFTKNLENIYVIFTKKVRNIYDNIYDKNRILFVFSHYISKKVN